jgi:hypothetical protein
MNTDTPPMKTITWKELWPNQKLIAAEEAHSLAAKALTQAELALRRIDADPSARCVAIQEEIDKEDQLLYACDYEQEDLIQTRRKQLEQALSHAETEHENTRPARLAALEEEIACRTDALGEARDERDLVERRVEIANLVNATFPLHSYATLSEAARAMCPVHIEKNQLGETYAQVEGVRIRITGDALLASLPPSSLSWALNSNPSNAVVPPLACHIYDRVVYIEEYDEVLVREIDSPRRDGFSPYADVFGSLKGALRPYVDELRALESIDISDGKPLPLLGEVVRDACRKIAADTVGDPKFLPGQRRLSDGQIYKLVGAVWRVFLDAPWEESTEGSYALLKYLCTRDETPSFFSYGTHGHFGFRVRTPDHEWIRGEIYCPPEYLSPTEGPELEVINRPLGQDWLAELGPVKFLIRGKTSRS